MSDKTKKVLAQLEDAWSFLRDPMIKLAIDEINRLQDEIKYLNNLIYPEHNPFLYTMSLTQQEAALLFAMYRTEKCSQEHLDMAMEVVDTKRSSDEAAVSGRVKVTICNLRKKLAFYDVDIINYRNFGYGLTADHKAKLKNIIEKGAAAGRIPLRQSR